MMGERVAVLRRTSTGVDAMGEPIYVWRAEHVDNVLVRPLSGMDMSDPKRPDGVTVQYMLAMPKTYTAAAKSLRGCRVAFIERGMDETKPDDALRVTGSPDVTRPCPTAWDMHVEVGRADG